MSVAPSTLGGPPPVGVRPPGPRLRILVPIVTLTLCWACGGGATDVLEAAAEREAFIGAYLDLRSAALSSGLPDLGDEVRDSILTVYGVTAQDLLDFVDMHGEDVEFMRDLWTEIETRMTELLEQNARDEEDQENEGIEGTEETDGGNAGVSP